MILRKETTYLFLLTATYFIISYFGILHHEFFIDEAHHWLLARDSVSIFDLVKNTRIEGHPLLWSSLLFVITRFTSNTFWMQFLHILISTSFVVVFLKKAPFDWLFKTLFIFGYFIVFEYNLISRNYSLGILFLFLTCSIFKDRSSKFLLLCIFLAITSNTHLMFSVIAFALFLVLMIEKFQNKQLFKFQIVFGILIFGLSLLSIIIQIQTINSSWLLNPISKIPFDKRLINGFISLFKGLITIPDFRTIHFWNSNLLVNLSKPISAIFALLIYYVPLLLFLKNKKTLYFVYLALFGTQLFFFITQRSATRFHGMTYIIIIIALWIEYYYETDNNKFRDYLYSLKLTLLKKPIIYTILTIQFFSGIYAYSMDIRYPFTSGKKTVEFLKTEKILSKDIVTVTCDGTLLSAYLEKKVYFLCDNSLQSYCNWDSSCWTNVTQEKAINMLTNYMIYHKNCNYVSYYPITNNLKNTNWITLNKKIKVRFIKKFDTNVVEKSNYFIYEVSKNQ